MRSLLFFFVLCFVYCFAFCFCFYLILKIFNFPMNEGLSTSETWAFSPSNVNASRGAMIDTVRRCGPSLYQADVRFRVELLERVTARVCCRTRAGPEEWRHHTIRPKEAPELHGKGKRKGKGRAPYRGCPQRRVQAV